MTSKPLDAEQRILRKLFRYGWALRFLAGFTGWLLMIFTDIDLIQDASYYDDAGASVANDWLNGRKSEWLELNGDSAHQPWVMVTVLGCVYFVLLGLRALPLVLLAYAAITAVVSRYTYLIARELGATFREAAVGAWIIAVSPAFVFWAGAMYKEGLILVVLNIAVYQILLLQRSWSLRSLFKLALCIMALSGLRRYLAAIVAVVVVFGLVVRRDRQSVSHLGPNAPSYRNIPQAMSAGGSAPLFLVRQVLLAVLFVGVMLGIGFTDLIQRMLPSDLEEGLGQIQSSRNDLATADSGYLQGADVSSVEGVLAFLPTGLLYFLVVPLPWQFGSLRQNIAIPDTLFWICMYPVVVMGMWRGLRARFQPNLLIIVMTLAICCFYAVFVGNIGTAYRLRIQVWLLWAPFVGMGWTMVSQALYGKPVVKRRAVLMKDAA